MSHRKYHPGIWRVTHTDTFGGEANFSWVNKWDFPGEKPPSIRAVKKLTGLTGIRCVVEDMGEGISIKPRGLCQIVFVDWMEAA